MEKIIQEYGKNAGKLYALVNSKFHKPLEQLFKKFKTLPLFSDTCRKAAQKGIKGIREIENIFEVEQDQLLFDFIHPGYHHRDSLFEPDQSGAEQREYLEDTAWSIRVNLVKYNLQGFIRRQSFCVIETLAAFLEEKRENTQKVYLCRFRHFFFWMETRGLTLPEITREHTGEYKAALEAESKSRGSIKSALGVIRAYFRYLASIQVIPGFFEDHPVSSKAEVVPAKAGQSPLDEVSCKKIIRALEEEVQTEGDSRRGKGAKKLLAVTVLALELGVRLGPLLNARLDREKRMVLIKEARANASIRLYNLSSQVIEQLEKAEVWNASFLQGTVKNSLQVQFKKFTRRLYEEKNLPRAYTFKDLRAYYTRGKYRETGDLFALQEDLGYASLDSLARYVG